MHRRLALGAETNLDNATWDTLIKDFESDVRVTFLSELEMCLFEKFWLIHDGVFPGKGWLTEVVCVDDVF